MNPETPLQNRIRKAVSKSSCGNALALRNNTGLFLTFAGDKVHAGLGKGTSDLIGLAARVIRPEDVGKTVGVFLAIEVKTEGSAIRPEQNQFIERIRQLGGIAGIARSPEEAEAMLSRAIGSPL